jgi:glycosyltransferase involved in cell wall biosynthesis
LETDKKHKIAICIPTFNREKELIRLLKSIISQQSIPHCYDFLILIIDNNIVSYLDKVIKVSQNTLFEIHSIHVKRKGLSNVRNAAVSWVLNRNMDALIFVDDDEVVPPHWLKNMVSAWEKYGADIITGPVAQILPLSAPRFVKKFHLLETNSNTASGTRIQFANSNNTLVSSKVLSAMKQCFHPALNHSGGEDILFFHQCYLKGFTIYWDNSVMVSEPTPPQRMTAIYPLRRWFHYGMTRISINQILDPRRWRRLSLLQIARAGINVPKGFAASIIKRDHKRFGMSICRLFWLTGIIMGFIGITLTNRIYNQ